MLAKTLERSLDAAPWSHEHTDNTWRFDVAGREIILRVRVVIPARNEALNIPIVAATLPPKIHEVIIVDGNSVDDTVAVAQLCHPRVLVLQQTGRGKGDALNMGFAHATGDVIIMMDADGSMDGRELAYYAEAMANGADFVKGSRVLLGGGSEDLTPLRRFGNAALRTAVNCLYGTHHTDLCYGYMGFWTKHRDTLHISCNGFEVETFLVIKAARAGLRTDEVPSYERNRVHGASNLNVVRDGCRVMSTVLGQRYGLGVR